MKWQNTQNKEHLHEQQIQLPPHFPDREALSSIPTIQVRRRNRRESKLAEHHHEAKQGSTFKEATSR